MLFLMAAGLTLVFGIMNLINLAHGSLYMAGAFVAAALIPYTGSFVISVIIAVAVTGVLGVLMEVAILRRFYARTHPDHVLVTFGLILVINEITRLIFGPVPVPLPLPDYLAGSIELFAGVRYPTFRLTILLVDAAVAIVLYSIAGFDWRKIPLIREAFRPFRYPLCDFRPQDIELHVDGRKLSQPWPPRHDRPFTPPRGWRGYCER